VITTFIGKMIYIYIFNKWFYFLFYLILPVFDYFFGVIFSA